MLALLAEWIKEKREIQLLLLIALMATSLSLAFRSSFPSPVNLKALAMGLVYDLMVAEGMTYLLILGGLDLSVGSNVALTSVITTLLFERWGITNVPLVIFMGLALSAVIGLLNGTVVARFKLNPFIVTLGMMAVARGIARVLTAGAFITKVPKSFLFIGSAEVFGVPLPVVLSIIIVALFDFLVRKWHPLNRAFYVGTHPDNAELVGLPVARIVIWGFIISGLFSGISAIFMSSHIGIGYSQFGRGMALKAMAAAVLGGADFTGGKGSVWGTFLGVLLLALVSNALVIIGLSIYWENVVNAAILILAIAANSFRRAQIS